MPGLPSDFKGAKSYYEVKTMGTVKANPSVLAPAKAKYHSKAKNSRFTQGQPKYKPS